MNFISWINSFRWISYLKINTTFKYLDNKAYAKAKVEIDAAYKNALPYFEKAYELEPDNESFKHSLRSLYYRLGMNDKYAVTVNKVENEKETNDMEKRFGRKKDENNMIENPLPVPKKKEKKVMDFAFQPEPFEMMYDIRVSEKDDFDV